MKIVLLVGILKLFFALRKAWGFKLNTRTTCKNNKKREENKVGKQNVRFGF